MGFDSLRVHNQSRFDSCSSSSGVTTEVAGSRPVRSAAIRRLSGKLGSIPAGDQWTDAGASLAELKLTVKVTLLPSFAEELLTKMRGLLLTSFSVPVPELSVMAALVGPDSLTRKYTLVEVVPVEGATKDELYSRALVWFGNAFKSAGDAISLSDREAGIITSSPNANFGVNIVTKGGKTIPWGQVKFTLRVECKDGRYRYTMTDFVNIGSDCDVGAIESKSLCLYKGGLLSLRADAGRGARETGESLRQAMTKTAPKSDW